MKKTFTLGLVASALLIGCGTQSGARAEGAAATAEVSDDESRIANAESAGPAAIARGAAIMDWPHMEGGEMRQLRAGTNGWVCMPSTPASAGAAGEDPMCLDEPWMTWVDAWANRTIPQIDRIGIGYMLQGDRGASNIDPFATGPTADNQWVQTPAHVMIVVPDAADLDAFPTDPSSGGPYVMWRGTPYAHIMVPVAQ
jgi:hypothetical protein